MSLQKSSESTPPTYLVNNEYGENSISVYKGELTQKGIAQGVAKVKAAFPALHNTFFDLLIERAKEKGFSDKRLHDSISNVIDNCQYPTPTLANFLSYDKRVKLMSYKEMCSAVTEGMASFHDSERVNINGKTFYLSAGDKERYNIVDF